MILLSSCGISKELIVDLNSPAVLTKSLVIMQGTIPETVELSARESCCHVYTVKELYDAFYSRIFSLYRPCECDIEPWFILCEVYKSERGEDLNVLKIAELTIVEFNRRGFSVHGAVYGTPAKFSREDYDILFERIPDSSWNEMQSIAAESQSELIVMIFSWVKSGTVLRGDSAFSRKELTNGI